MKKTFFAFVCILAIHGISFAEEKTRMPSGTPFENKALSAADAGGPGSTAENKGSGVSAPRPPAAFVEFEAQRKKIMELQKEKIELMKNSAAPDKIQTKADEISKLQREAIESLRKSYPNSMPMMPPPGMAPPHPPQALPFSPAEQAQMKALVEKRREMVKQGATHEDVKGVTDEIRKIIDSKMPAQPPALPTPQAKEQAPAKDNK